MGFGYCVAEPCRRLIALLIFGIYLANGGGVTQKVSQNLGLRDGIVRIYNENAATNNVYAEIKGYWTSDA